MESTEWIWKQPPRGKVMPTGSPFIVIDNVWLEDHHGNDDDRSEYPQPDPCTWTCTACCEACWSIPQMCPHVEPALPGIVYFLFCTNKGWMTGLRERERDIRDCGEVDCTSEHMPAQKHTEGMHAHTSKDMHTHSEKQTSNTYVIHLLIFFSFGLV